MCFEAQQDALCAVHALSHILQEAYPAFSAADLQEGVHLAEMADAEMQAPGPAFPHALPGGWFSSEAVGFALGRRRFDWRGVELVLDAAGQPNPQATMAAAFDPVNHHAGPLPTLGIFIHHGHHYTAMISQEERTYHIDSLPISSGERRYVYEVSLELFCAYVQRFATTGHQQGGRRLGGVFRVFYTGQDLLAGPAVGAVPIQQDSPPESPQPGADVEMLD